jgi:hypothetical protein
VDVFEWMYWNGCIGVDVLSGCIGVDIIVDVIGVDVNWLKQVLDYDIVDEWNAVSWLNGTDSRACRCRVRSTEVM